MEKWRATYDALTVRKSRFSGRGLFAGTDIAARAKIGEYEGERIGLAEARFRYINHSCDPNTFFRCTPERAEVYALRDIRAGEELTCDYGESQHEGTLRCRCGAPNCRGYL